jgi:hypothetical protein
MDTTQPSGKITCTCCKVPKDLNAFTTRKDRWGYFRQCKECLNRKFKERQARKLEPAAKGYFTHEAFADITDFYNR